MSSHGKKVSPDSSLSWRSSFNTNLDGRVPTNSSLAGECLLIVL